VPKSGLRGSYTLDEETIDRVVKKISAGAYGLGSVKDNTFYFRYIGRSDDNINVRLKNHVGEYTRFKFEFYPSPKAAFEKECDLRHDWGGPDGTLDNKNHPDRPEDAGWKCPRCDAFD
jgi:hypothetical protein